jgi:crotonobetainyl-CoA:carnitine CoA-transferase CaiB-like acyl-CoA transferase
VLLENNRPGALEKLGLGPEDLKKVNPRIVYMSVSGFGQTGPDRRRAGVNLIAEAASGTLGLHGHQDDLPMRPGIETADIFGALFAAYGIVCGLMGVNRFGEGNVADLALVEASIAAAPWQTSGYFATGEIPTRLGHSHRLNAPYQVFRTGDGRHVALGTPNQELFLRFMKRLGETAALEDPRFATYVNRKNNKAAIVAIVETALASWTADDLVAALMEDGIPCSPVRNFEEVFADPHIVDRGVVVEIKHPKLGTVKSIRNPVVFEHDAPSIERAAPLLGQHSAEILREFGYSDAEIDGFAKSGVTKLA